MDPMGHVLKKGIRNVLETVSAPCHRVPKSSRAWEALVSQRTPSAHLIFDVSWKDMAGVVSPKNVAIAKCTADVVGIYCDIWSIYSDLT